MAKLKLCMILMKGSTYLCNSTSIKGIMKVFLLSHLYIRLATKIVNIFFIFRLCINFLTSSTNLKWNDFFMEMWNPMDGYAWHVSLYVDQSQVENILCGILQLFLGALVGHPYNGKIQHFLGVSKVAPWLGLDKGTSNVGARVWIVECPRWTLCDGERYKLCVLVFYVGFVSSTCGVHVAYIFGGRVVVVFKLF